MPEWRRVQQPWRKWDVETLRRNLGVYVHIPFCLARCGYCNFLTYGNKRPPGLGYESFHVALLKEIERRGAWATRHYGKAGRAVDAVFFGGGTPTSQPPEHLCSQLAAVRKYFDLTEDAEVTVEANPDTLTPAYIEQLASVGVNRLSIGIQSTQSRTLRFMDRTHRWQDILPVLAGLRRGPIRRFSFDLLYGVPGQTAAMLKESLRRLLSLGPEQISAYELTCEPDTPYHCWAEMFPGQLPDQAAVVCQSRLITRVLAGYGFHRYEVCSYARPGAECWHNLRYWLGGDYLGLGLGAASRIGTEVVNNPSGYVDYRGVVDTSGTATDQLVAVAGDTAPGCAPEADTFLQLRTRRGILRQPGSVPNSWVRNGWVMARNGRLEVTATGLDFADLLAREL